MRYLHAWARRSLRLPATRRVKLGALLGIASTLSLLVVSGAAAGAVGRSPQVTSPARRLSVGATHAGTSQVAQAGNLLYTTSRGSNSRDGWYPDEPGLSPKVVGSPNFKQVFATQLNGQIYAQPLLVGKVVLVATETDWVYGLDPETGAIVWSRHLATAFRDKSLGCGDLLPSLGVTSTPTVDPATGVVYLVAQEYVAGKIAWLMHAVNPATGAEMPHFPVMIKGPASNNPLQVFRYRQMQRPGLLFLGGVVYAAFGTHCEIGPYSGVVVGVSTSGHETTMWTDQGKGTDSGGGIWQGGGGLTSDGPNQILFASGNGYAPSSHPPVPTPGSSPPPNLADSVVRLVVQPNGSLKAKDFFSRYDDQIIDGHDWDLAGSPVALPSQFSTPQYPHLLVATGKEGIVYLLNRDSLGGAGEGPRHKDLALGEYQAGEAISTAGAWPGNGGYVYVSTDNGGANGGGQGHVDVYRFTVGSKGRPGLRLVGTGSQVTVFGVSGPLVTSDGMKPGSAVVWVVDGGNLQAYDPVPANGKLTLIGTWPVGNPCSFAPPGIGEAMVYMGNQEGVLYGFGTKPSPAGRLS